MGIEIILKVAGIGILVAIACQLLKQSGRDDIAMITGLAGLVLSLMLILSYVGSLFNTVIQIFGL
ncbi:MAG: stage III sporulation protein AC [Eubacteriales bacterium]|nr:stage III sporulation protein AC [Eubacteriales bacterium]MCI7571076.1 stage III sporulation protein AC [Clostridiales bacterium]MDD7550121.1 stage III sporulation protein AC [Clostridia bacterium]MDY5754815.1 stage III sporulation protein AC [Eubacteriales bacterium]